MKISKSVKKAYSTIGKSRPYRQAVGQVVYPVSEDHLHVSM